MIRRDGSVARDRTGEDPAITDVTTRAIAPATRFRFQCDPSGVSGSGDGSGAAGNAGSARPRDGPRERAIPAGMTLGVFGVADRGEAGRTIE